MIDMTVTSRAVENLLTADLIPYAANARRHNPEQVNQIASSIKEFGFQNPVLIDEQNGIVAGHGRVMAAQKLGLATVPCLRVVGLSDARKRAYIIADNKLAMNAGWDSDTLIAELDAIREDGMFDLVGFSPEDLDALGEELSESVDDKETKGDDEVPEEQAEVFSKRGEVYDLGPHRMMCGDSTSEEDVARLMDGEKAELCFTSPPYAEQRKDQYGGTNESKYVDWFNSVYSGIGYALSDDGIFILNIKPHASGVIRSTYVFDLVKNLIEKHKLIFVDEFCWLRTGIPQQVVNRFKNAFEPCYWFAKSCNYKWFPESVMHKSKNVPKGLGKGAGDTNAARRQGKGGGAIQGNEIVEGMAYPSNVLDFKQNADAIGHPAAFPIQLPLFFLQCMSSPKSIVYDPFCGSGTTIVAAAKTGRICRAMEIDPRYCDVIRRRYTRFAKENNLPIGSGGLE